MGFARRVVRAVSHTAVPAALLFLVSRAGAAPLPRNYAVESYDVSIAPDLAAKRLSGEDTIRFHSRIERLDALEFDAGDLTIASVTDNQAPQWFERKGSLLIVVLGNPVRAGEHRSVSIRYQAGPGKGLQFFPDQVYTSSVTSDWMVCNDRPDEPATLRLRIHAPSLKVAATENLESPTPPFLYAFAAGAFEESTSETSRVKLRVLGHAPVFEPAIAAMHFLAERTGRPYPGGNYTLVFAHGTVKQTAAGITLLPESYAADLSAHPENLWLLAGEIAEQWYGVGILCKDWSDLWLSEGLAAFLADAFLEQRFGKPRYEQEVEIARKIYETLKAEGQDRPLSFSDWETPQQAGGQVPVFKGAWFLAQLRRQMSDEAFWRGLRLYTSQFWGRSTVSVDFEKSMETAAGKLGSKNLAKFFEHWVAG